MNTVSQRQQGFTLIEVLVALVLLALVSLISWRGLDAVQHAGERLDSRAEATLSMVRALAQIERDILLHAGADILPGLVPATADMPDTKPDIKPGTSPTSGLHQLMPPGISWSPARGLELVRAAGDGRWQQLRWYLQDGHLFRVTGQPSYLLPLPQAEISVVVLDQVDGFTVKAWGPGQGWIDPTQGRGASEASSDSPVSGSGLEVAIYRHDAPDSHPYRKVVVLP